MLVDAMPELPSRCSECRKGALVGVVASREDVAAARTLAPSWDLCELRIDLLAANCPEILPEARTLAHPKIITVRDPAEGGALNWSLEQRHQFYSDWLPIARYVDLELRNLKFFSTLLNAAKEQGCQVIVSFHDFEKTPIRAALDQMAGNVKEQVPGAIFKVATRTDRWEDIRTLADFLHAAESDRVAVMGMGSLGKISRLLLAKLGSCLTYAAFSQGVV